MNTASSQCRTPFGSSWNALMPANSPETSRTGNYTPCKPDQGSDQENAHVECSCICIWHVRRIPEERTNSGCGNGSRGCMQQSPCQAADGPARANGVSLVLTRWTAGAPLEKYNGPTTRITTLLCIHRWLTSDPVSVLPLAVGKPSQCATTGGRKAQSVCYHWR